MKCNKTKRKISMPFREAFGREEIKSMKRVISYYRKKNTDPLYRGKFEKDFTSSFAKYMGGGYSCAVATGTASVYVALQALKLKPKSEILISPFIDAGPVNCVILQGHTPVIVDTAKNSYNADVDNFLSKVTKKTEAVLLVHSAGEPILNIETLYKELKKRKIKLLEDCSQAPGAKVSNKKVGSIGDIAAFSTMYRKTLTSGASGGLIFTKNLKLYKNALAYSDRGKPIWRTNYDFRNPGLHLFPALNWNTDEFRCAIGKSSLKRLDKALKLRMNFVNLFTSELELKSKICKAYSLPRFSSPFFLPIWVDTKKIRCSKKKFAIALQNEGVFLNADYKFLVSDWKWFKKYSKQSLKLINANNTRDNSFNLFLNEKYGLREVQFIIKKILKIERIFIKKKIVDFYFS